MNWSWVVSNAGALRDATIAHIALTLVAVAVGFAISFALALAIYRRPALAGAVTGVTGVLYTIPSLALFAFLVPFTGLSFLTAQIGLVSYTLLILIRNIVEGLRAVPADVREAADAMGYGSARRLLRIELPLAMPFVVAGLRIATVTTIGLVMVAQVIGQGGLGQVMVRGFNFRNDTAVYVGAILIVGLAIAADLLLAWLGRAITPWVRARAER